MYFFRQVCGVITRRGIPPIAVMNMALRLLSNDVTNRHLIVMTLLSHNTPFIPLRVSAYYRPRNAL